MHCACIRLALCVGGRRRDFVGCALLLLCRGGNLRCSRVDLNARPLHLADQLAQKPGFALRSTKQHVNAVMEEIAGTGRSANDADTLVAALGDQESVEASRRYLAARAKR